MLYHGKCGDPLYTWQYFVKVVRRHMTIDGGYYVVRDKGVVAGLDEFYENFQLQCVAVQIKRGKAFYNECDNKTLFNESEIKKIETKPDVNENDEYTYDKNDQKQTKVFRNKTKAIDHVNELGNIVDTDVNLLNDVEISANENKICDDEIKNSNCVSRAIENRNDYKGNILLKDDMVEEQLVDTNIICTDINTTYFISKNLCQNEDPYKSKVCIINNQNKGESEIEREIYDHKRDNNLFYNNYNTNFTNKNNIKNCIKYDVYAKLCSRPICKSLQRTERYIFDETYLNNTSVVCKICNAIDEKEEAVSDTFIYKKRKLNSINKIVDKTVDSIINYNEYSLYKNDGLNGKIKASSSKRKDLKKICENYKNIKNIKKKQSKAFTNNKVIKDNLNEAQIEKTEQDLIKCINKVPKDDLALEGKEAKDKEAKDKESKVKEAKDKEVKVKEIKVKEVKEKKEKKEKKEVKEIKVREEKKEKKVIVKEIKLREVKEIKAIKLFTINNETNEFYDPLEGIEPVLKENLEKNKSTEKINPIILKKLKRPSQNILNFNLEKINPEKTNTHGLRFKPVKTDPKYTFQYHQERFKKLFTIRRPKDIYNNIKINNNLDKNNNCINTNESIDKHDNINSLNKKDSSINIEKTKTLMYKTSINNDLMANSVLGISKITFIKFHDQIRPPLYEIKKKIGNRNTLKKIKDVNYEYDSDAEWIYEEGESVDISETESEETPRSDDSEWIEKDENEIGIVSGKKYEKPLLQECNAIFDIFVHDEEWLNIPLKKRDFFPEDLVEKLRLYTGKEDFIVKKFALEHRINNSIVLKRLRILHGLETKS
ncbi:hypothetical protein COBT_002371 [Conglomerata obtusa]